MLGKAGPVIVVYAGKWRAVIGVCESGRDVKDGM